MSDPITAALTQAEALTAAASRAVLSSDASAKEPAAPPKAVWGGAFADCSTAYPLAAAKALGRPPRELAALLAAQMALEGTCFTSVEAAGPGFLNFFLSPRWYETVLETAETMDLRQGHAVPLPDQEAIRLLLNAKPDAPIAPDLSLRRDRGNPLYRLRYALQRLNRLPEAPDGVKEFSFSPTEQSLIKAIAACLSVLRCTEAEADYRAAARSLLPLTDALHSYHTTCRFASTSPRPRLLNATRKALENSMGMLGIAVK